MKLDGIRVLDLSRFLPGPYIGLAMADHGAEVIKIESFEGEPTRNFGPKVAGFTPYFRNSQRGKLSLRLNLKTPEGKVIFLQLAREADVIIESFRPGVAKRLGIDYETIAKENPRIVYCAMSAFGQKGRLAQRPSHDLGAQAMTGVLSLGQTDGRAPSLPAAPTADIAQSSLSLAGIAMALYRRETTGRGDYLDMSMTDALMSWTPHALSNVLGADTAPDLGEERLYGGAAFYNVYETKDGGHLVLSGSEMSFVRNLLTALGREDLIDCCREWGSAQQPVREFLNEAFKTRTAEEWDAWLADVGVCHAVVNDLREGWQLPVFRERGMIRTGRDGVEYLGTPIHFGEEPGEPSDYLAQLGGNNDDILEKLGYDEQARTELKAKGVC